MPRLEGTLDLAGAGRFEVTSQLELPSTAVVLPGAANEHVTAFQGITSLPSCNATYTFEDLELGANTSLELPVAACTIVVDDVRGTSPNSVGFGAGSSISIGIEGSCNGASFCP